MSLSVVMLGFIMPRVIMPSVYMLNVGILNDIKTLSVVKHSFVELFHVLFYYAECHIA